MKNKKIMRINILLIIFSALIIFGCGKKSTPEMRTAESIFVEAKDLYNKEKYQQARELFDLIKLQHPASQFADDAQFYLAEIGFNRKEYILAAFNYGMLRRLYPSSPFRKQALYNTAICYYKLSPGFDRDQEYTNKAIETFQEFQYTYPQDSLFAEASKYIDELRNKLAERLFSTANLYLKLDSPHSAVIYFDYVIRDYEDTKFYEPSYVGKIESFMLMKKYDEARGIIRLFINNFPNSRNKEKIIEFENQILQNL